MPLPSCFTPQKWHYLAYGDIPEVAQNIPEVHTPIPLHDLEDCDIPLPSCFTPMKFVAPCLPDEHMLKCVEPTKKRKAAALAGKGKNSRGKSQTVAADGGSQPHLSISSPQAALQRGTSQELRREGPFGAGRILRGTR